MFITKSGKRLAKTLFTSSEYAALSAGKYERNWEEANIGHTCFPQL